MAISDKRLLEGTYGLIEEIATIQDDLMNPDVCQCGGIQLTDKQVRIILACLDTMKRALTNYTEVWDEKAGN